MNYRPKYKFDIVSKSHMTHCEIIRKEINCLVIKVLITALTTQLK